MENHHSPAPALTWLTLHPCLEQAKRVAAVSRADCTDLCPFPDFLNWESAWHLKKLSSVPTRMQLLPSEALYLFGLQWSQMT